MTSKTPATKRGASYINQITDDDITCFLAKYKSKNVHLWTHENRIIPLGNYDLSDESVQKEFHSIYVNRLKTCGPELVVGIKERGQADWPVVIRVTVKAYTANQTLECAKVAQQALVEVFPENEWSDELADCFILESDGKTTERSVRVSAALKKSIKFEDEAANYFVLHFPRIFLRQETLELLFYPVVHRALQRVFGLEANSKLSVIDSDLLSQSYLMYGSRMYSHLKPMHVSKVVNFENEPITLVQALRGYRLFDFDKNALTELEPETEDEARLLLPRVLSIHRCHRHLYDIDSTTFLGHSSIIEVARQYVCRQAMIKWYRRNCSSDVGKIKNRNLKKNKPIYFNPKQADSDHPEETYDDAWTSIPIDRMKDIDRELKTEGERVGLMDMLGKNRAQKKHQWVELGRYLWDLYGGNQRGLERFVEFTKKHEQTPRPERHDEPAEDSSRSAEDSNDDESDEENGETPASPKKPNRSPRPQTPTAKEKPSADVRCLSLWNRIEPGATKTISSLHVLCREDSTVAYREFLLKRRETLLISAILDQSHVKVAKLIQSELGNRFVCSNSQKGNWYEFKDHRWHKQSGGEEFNKAAQTFMDSVVNDQLNEWESKITSLKQKARKSKNSKGISDEERDIASNHLLQEIARFDIHHKCLEKLGRDFGKNGFKNSVIRECANLMFQRGFENRLNQDPDLLHFSNGVLDLSAGPYREGILRAGKPEDYLTKTCGYDYPVHITSIDHPEVVRVIDHLMKVFPRHKLREWFLEFAGGLLRGGNPHKLVAIFNGGGHNGKSVTNDILHLALGDYYAVVPVTFLTGRRADSGNATPEIANIDGVRYLVMNEPDANEVINSGKLKEFSGNDLIMVRGLFAEPRVILPMFKMAIIANMLPNFSVDDPAVWARVRKLNFESCLPENDTRVLTNRGFLFLWEIEWLLARDENVQYACYEPSTKTIVYQPGCIVLSAPPSRWVEFTQSSPMKSNLSVRVTPEHLMYVQFNRGSSVSSVSSGSSVNVPSQKVAASEMVAGVECKCPNSQSCYHGYHSFRMLTAATNGVVLGNTSTFDREQLRLVIEGIRQGSPGRDVEGCNSISTPSVSFRDDLVRACLHAGYSAYFTIDKTVVDSDNWCVVYSDVDSSVLQAQDVRYDGSEDKTNEYDAERDGRVWCVQVEHPDHLIFVQRVYRNNSGIITKVSKAVIVGNCFENNSEVNEMPMTEQLEKKRFPMDPHFANFVPKMKLGMMWLMHHYHRKLSRYSRSPEPKEIIEATLSYRVENDPVDRFLRDCVVSTNKRATKDKAGNLTSTAEDSSYMLETGDEFKTMLGEHEIVNLQENDLFASYTKWFTAQGINSKGKPGKRNFVESLIKFYGNPTDTRKPEAYKGWKFVYVRMVHAFRANGTPVAAESAGFNNFSGPAQ